MREKTEQHRREIILRCLRQQRLQNGLMPTVHAVKIADGERDGLRQCQTALPTVNLHESSRVKKRAL
jgi:hypothetical protein